jgi:PilZ domain
MHFGTGVVLMTDPTILFRVERRVWVRLRSGREVHCRKLARAPHTGWLGTVLDVSRGGISFSLRRQILPGTELLIELANNAGELRRLPVQVIHTRLEREGYWITGCAFASTLSSAELQTFLPE